MYRSDESCWNYLESACPAIDIGSWKFWLVLVATFYLVFFDVSFCLRSFWDRFKTKLCSSDILPTALSTHVYHGVCLTTGMDFSHSMKCSATFLKECELAFRAFVHSSGLDEALRHFDATLTNSSNNLKFRKAVSFCSFYSIHTSITWWDEQSLFIKQKLLGRGDRTVCAINYSRQTVQGASPQELLDYLPGCSCLPEIPPDVASWVVCIRTVNRLLTLSGH